MEDVSLVNTYESELSFHDEDNKLGGHYVHLSVGIIVILCSSLLCLSSLVAAHLTTSNTILLTVGVVLLCVDIVLFVVLMAVEVKTKKGNTIHHIRTGSNHVLKWKSNFIPCRPVCNSPAVGGRCPDGDVSSAVGGSWVPSGFTRE